MPQSRSLAPDCALVALVARRRAPSLGGRLFHREHVAEHSRPALGGRIGRQPLDPVRTRRRARLTKASTPTRSATRPPTYTLDCEEPLDGQSYVVIAAALTAAHCGRCSVCRLTPGLKDNARQRRRMSSQLEASRAHQHCAVRSIRSRCGPPSRAFQSRAGGSASVHWREEVTSEGDGGCAIIPAVQRSSASGAHCQR